MLQGLLDTSSKMQQQQFYRRKCHMDAITELSKKWPIYEPMQGSSKVKGGIATMLSSFMLKEEVTLQLMENAIGTLSQGK